MLLFIRMAVNTAKFTFLIDQLKELEQALANLDDETYWAGTALDHALFVERGTSEAKKSSDGQAAERIQEWAKSKSIPAGAAIHTILEREGTEPHPFRKPALEKAASEYSDLILDVNHGGSVSTVEVAPEAFLGDEGERPIEEIAEFVSEEMKNQFGKGSGSAGDPPQSDTGTLKDSITHAPTASQLIQQSRGQ